jgi:hypothetical protein
MMADDDDVNNDQPWDDDARRRMEGDMLWCHVDSSLVPDQWHRIGIGVMMNHDESCQVV